MTPADITLAHDANAIGQHWVLYRGHTDVVAVEGCRMADLIRFVNAVSVPIEVRGLPGRWHRWIAYGRHA